MEVVRLSKILKCNNESKRQPFLKLFFMDMHFTHFNVIIKRRGMISNHTVHHTKYRLFTDKHQKQVVHKMKRTVVIVTWLHG